MVVFVSKYGSTGAYARSLARELGCLARETSRVSPGELEAASFLALGAPIYRSAVLPPMAAFLDLAGPRLRGKPLAAFVVCGDNLWLPRAEEGGHRNLEKLLRLLPHEALETAVFGGRMIMEQLDETDRPAILAFYKRIGRAPMGFDRMELDKVPEFAGRIQNTFRVPGSAFHD